LAAGFAAYEGVERGQPEGASDASLKAAQ
jgi:hypothetical protein